MNPNILFNEINTIDYQESTKLKKKPKIDLIEKSDTLIDNINENIKNAKLTPFKYQHSNKIDDQSVLSDHYIRF